MNRTPTQVALRQFQTEGGYHPLSLQLIVQLIHQPGTMIHKDHADKVALYQQARDAQNALVLRRMTPKRIPSAKNGGRK